MKGEFKLRIIAKLPKEDRDALFRNTADKMGLSFAIVEKDFWVSYTLDYLFSRCKWRDRFAFKGGTSLSKAYGLIKRFSEDIDLILDWRLLGFATAEPWEKRSNTKQVNFNKNLNEQTSIFLQDKFIPTMLADFSSELDDHFQCTIDPNDGQTVLFRYPSEQRDLYIRSEIRLEIGALAAWSPATWRAIVPLAAQEYPHLFTQQKTNALTVSPTRTFWEKATILHQEAHRKADSGGRQRRSRHYYDFFQMCCGGIKENALNDIQLLKDVVEFKQRFYPCP